MPRHPSASADASVDDVPLEDLAATARATGRLGIDTEFMSEGRYSPQLCLVQVALDDDDRAEPRTALIDAMTLDDPTPLAEVLADPEIEIVLHAARADVAILRRAWRTEVRNLFDTQVAAAFAGLGSQLGYSNLVGRLVGVELAKGETFTRWDERPLKARQLKYARQDVEHLLAAADQLTERLVARDRLEWVRDECRLLEQVEDGRDPEIAYQRLPRLGKLKPPDVAIARELAAWRERTAASEDRTTNAVLGDTVLMEIVRRRPETTKGLRDIRGLYPRTIQRRGEDIIAAVARGVAADPVRLDRPPRPLRQQELPLVPLAEALVRSRAQDAGLAYDLITSRAELTAIVRARDDEEDPDVRTLRGWREDLVGDDLRALLGGRRALSVDGRGRLAVSEREPAGDA